MKNNILRDDFDCPVADFECPFFGSNGCCQLDYPEEECDYLIFGEEEEEF